MTLANTSRAGLTPFPRRAGFRCPSCERLPLASGFEVWTTVDHTVPIVHLLCALPLGALCDPPGKEGLASLVLMLLGEGTVNRGAAEISEDAEDRGADVITRLGWEAGSVAIELLAGDSEFGLELLAELLWSPSFPRQGFERGVRRQRGRLKQRRWNPVNLADLWFAHTVFGETRYGRSMFGSDSSLAQIQREDVLAFHRRHFGPAEAVLVAAGSFDPRTLIRTLESLLPADFGQADRDAVAIEPPRATPSGPILVDLPAARQTELRIGLAGTTTDLLDRAGLETLAAILRLRLGLNLRDRRAATYSITSRFEARRGSGLFFVSAAVDNRQVGSAVNEVFEAIMRLRGGLPPQHELLEVRSELIGALLRSFQSIDGWAARLQELAFNHWPADYFHLYVESLHRLQPEDLRRLALRHLDLEQLVIVAVGPADELRDQLAPWGKPVKIDSTVEPHSFERGNAS